MQSYQRISAAQIRVIGKIALIINIRLFAKTSCLATPNVFC